MLKRHWPLLAASLLQIILWSVIVHPTLPSINAISQILDMKTLFGIGRSFNERLVAPWHPTASFLTLPGILLFSDPVFGSRVVWLVLQLCLTALVYFAALKVFSQYAAWFVIFVLTFNSTFYDSSLSLSTEMVSFVFSTIPLVIYLRNAALASRHYAFMGVSLGLAVLARIEYLAVFPLYLILFLTKEDRRTWRRIIARSAWASIACAAVVAPQVIWVHSAHGSYALMPPFEGFTFSSASHMVPESLWKLNDTHKVEVLASWHTPGLSISGLRETIQVAAAIAGKSIFYPHLVKLLFIVGFLFLLIKPRQHTWAHFIVAAIALVIPMLNVYAAAVSGIDMTSRRLWTSAPFVVLLAGYGFSLLYSALFSVLSRGAQGAYLKIVISPYTRIIVFVIALVFVEHITIRYNMSTGHRRQNRELALQIDRLKKLITRDEREFVCISAPNMQIPFLLDEAYVPFPPCEGRTPDQWLRQLREWRADYLVLSPAVMERLPRRFRNELEARLAPLNATIMSAEWCTAYDLHRAISPESAE